MNINTLKEYEPANKLESNVKDIILSEVSEDYFEGWFEGLMSHGCISGMVGALVYYTDTQNFYNEHINFINDLVKDLLWEIGADCMTDLFGGKFDKEDPLCLDATNQNLLAWFGFEEVARRIGNEIGLEL